MNSGASPHHRIVSGKSGIGVGRALQRTPGRAPDGFGCRDGRGRQGGLAGGSSSLSTLPEPVQSGDVVRTRMDAGVSPHCASGDEARCRSGENPRQQRRLTTSPDCFREIRKTWSRWRHHSPRSGRGRARHQVGTARQGGLAGGSSPRLFTNPEKRSGDVVRTRMNTGASPHHRIQAGKSAKGVVPGPTEPTCPTCGCLVHPQPRTWEVVCTSCGEKRWPLSVLEPASYVCPRCGDVAGEAGRGAGGRPEVGGGPPEAGCALICVPWGQGCPRARSPPWPASSEPP